MLIAVAYIVVQRLFKGTPVPISLEIVAGHVLVLAEAALAVSVALVIRAAPRPTLVNLAAGAALGACWIYVRWFIGYTTLSHWPAAGIFYAAAMVVATFAVLRVANRMWTTEKLLACARQGT